MKSAMNFNQMAIAAVFVASIRHRMMDNRQKQVTKQLVACVNAIEDVVLK